MSEPVVTIVVVPRESFEYSEAALESILHRSHVPFRLVYVDGNSPPHVRRYLDRRASEANFTLVRTPHYLAPNDARNIGLEYVESPFVVFVDNNAIVADGWLEPLLTCAEERDAAFVSPVYLVGSFGEGRVHTASGEGRIDVVDGVRTLVDEHRNCHLRLHDIRDRLRREPCEVAEFHCVLARTDVVSRIGGCDPRLPAALEHIDFCIQAAGHAGGGWFEPESVVTYRTPPPLSILDAPFYALRWSDAWIDASFEHFATKWDLPRDDPGLRANRAWLDRYRFAHVRYLRGAARRVFGASGGRMAEALTDFVVSATLVRRGSTP